MDNSKYTELTPKQWGDVLTKAKDNKAVMFVLRCWANSQSVSWGSINAFSERVETSDDGRTTASLRIGHITRWVQLATSREDACCYFWNKNAGEWSIGFNQAFALREAFGEAGEP